MSNKTSPKMLIVGGQADPLWAEKMQNVASRMGLALTSSPDIKSIDQLEQADIVVVGLTSFREILKTAEETRHRFPYGFIAMTSWEGDNVTAARRLLGRDQVADDFAPKSLDEGELEKQVRDWIENFELRRAQINKTPAGTRMKNLWVNGTPGLQVQSELD